MPPLFHGVDGGPTVAPRCETPVPDVPHPHLDHFLAAFQTERVWGQVLLRRRPGSGSDAGIELCHVGDQSVPFGQLRRIPVHDLRSVAESTGEGTYRPLKGAPNLPAGWGCVARNEGELAAAVHHLYPGSMADAWAWEVGAPGVAEDFAAVADRQLGRMKKLTGLRGEGLSAAVEAGCGVGACVRRRCWTATGIGREAPEGKSAIPCLEPCPFFLGFARACVEIEEESTVPVEFAPDDLATLAAALRHALEHPPRGSREGDVVSPLHRWRVSRVLARYPALRSAVATPSPKSDE